MIEFMGDKFPESGKFYETISYTLDLTPFDKFPKAFDSTRKFILKSGYKKHKFRTQFLPPVSLTRQTISIPFILDRKSRLKSSVVGPYIYLRRFLASLPLIFWAIGID